MADKHTQTSLSSHNTTTSAHDSASVSTLFANDDTHDLGDVLERNEGFATNSAERPPEEKHSVIVDWDGPDDPAGYPPSPDSEKRPI
jgi:DHA1 family multidrug resistance protein-like MFS transporter